MTVRWALAFAPLAAGCGLTQMFEPDLGAVSEETLTIAATDVWSLQTEARLPTDVAPLEGGGFTVIDGYRRRALQYDAAHQATREVHLDTGEGLPIRTSLAADGKTWWFTVPGAGTLLRMSVDGDLVETVHLTDAEGKLETGVTAAHDTGAALVVGLPDGRLGFYDAKSGQMSSAQLEDVDGVPFGMIVDIEDAGGGDLLVVDAYGAKVHRVDATDGTPKSWVGHLGLWAGYLAKPKSATAGPDGTVVTADSELGVVQVFDGDGAALGVIARDGEMLRFGHPIAVQAVGDGRFLALDQADATVWGFTLSDDDVAKARATARGARHLRTRLVEKSHDERLADGTLCRQCHDGTILDHRQNWDPDLGHHPVDVVPENGVPKFFPLSEDGRIVCTTCHSPHGVVDVEGVEAVEAGAEVSTLVRHAPREEGDLFTRLSRTESELCTACHSTASHERVLESVGLVGTSHPTGKALADSLGKRGTVSVAGLPAGVDTNCLTCHAVHAASREGLNRKASSGEVCLACHQVQGKPGRNHRLGEKVAGDRRVQAASLPTSVDGAQTCYTCHNLLGGRTEAMLQAPPGGSLCTTCHDPDKAGGPHGRVKGTAGLSCLGCHDVHDAPLSNHLLTTVAKGTPRDPTGCVTCHAANPKAAVAPGALGHPVQEPDLTCAECHDPHQPGSPPTCTSCHDEQNEAQERGGHGTAQCTDCHPIHSRAPVLAASLHPKGEPLNPISATCLACHGAGTRPDARKVAVYEHPAPVFTPTGERWTPLASLPLFDATGKLAPPGSNGALTCGTCHETHGPNAQKPVDHLRRPGWQEACAACHGDEALVFYKFFHKPASRRIEGAAP